MKRLVGEMVIVSGEEEFDAAVGRRGRLEVTHLAAAAEEAPLPGDFWENKTAAEQAREQGVASIVSIGDFVAGDVLDEVEIERFIETLREGRREE